MLSSKLENQHMIEIYAITGDYQSGQRLVQDLLQRKALFTSQSIQLDPDLRQMLEDPTIQLTNHQNKKLFGKLNQ